jgi:hypothetical protein
LVCNPEVITLSPDFDFGTHIFSSIVVKWCLAEGARVLYGAAALLVLLVLRFGRRYTKFGL